MTIDPSICIACAAPGDPVTQFCTSCGALRPDVVRPDVVPGCRTCGEPAPSTTAFCVHCGTAVAAPPDASLSPAPVPPAVPAPPDTIRSVPRARRRRVGLVASGVLVLALSGVGVGGYLLLGRDANDSASDTAGPLTETVSDVPTDPVATPTIATPEASSGAPPSASPSEAPVVVAPAAACWDGGTAALLKECGEPRGRDGLFWMFPSMVDQASRCADIADPRKDGKLLVRHCEIPTDDGVVEINYSWWRQVDRMQSYYATEFDVIDAVVDGDLTAYRYDLRLGQWKGALHYRDLPFSATVYASTSELLTKYLSEDPLVVARPAAEHRGVSGS